VRSRSAASSSKAANTGSFSTEADSLVVFFEGFGLVMSVRPTDVLPPAVYSLSDVRLCWLAEAFRADRKDCEVWVIESLDFFRELPAAVLVEEGEK
jgi:hypothetical protein